MVSGVSGVPNGGYVSYPVPGSMDRVPPEYLNQPGSFADAATVGGASQEAPKKGSFLGKVAKFALKLVGVVALAIAARKYMPAMKKWDGKVLKEGAGKMDKAKHYFAKYTDLAYGKLEQGTDKVISRFHNAKNAESEAGASVDVNA